MENKKLYIWFNTLGRSIKGIPQDHFTWFKDINDFNAENKLGEWLSYNWRDGKPEGKYKMPNELYLFIKSVKKPLFDFYPTNDFMIVSSSLLKYFIDNKLEDQIEVSNLRIFNTDGVEHTNKKYYVVRVFQFNDDLFNLNEETRKRVSGAKDKFFYPDLSLKSDIVNQDVFFLNNLFGYHDTIILNEKAKNYVLQNFYIPEIYDAKVFNIAYNNQTDKTKLPEIVKL